MIGQIDKLYIKTRKWKLYSRYLSYLFFEGRPLTTKGQWINSLVFLLYKVWANLPQLKKVNKPIFIIGIGRSGSTALGITMSMHKQVGFLNEPKALWHAAYGKEDVIGSYSREDAHYSLDHITPSQNTAKSFHKFYGAYLLLSFSKRIVDKYPELVYRTNFVDLCFSDAKYLFLVRNGWDTLHSIDLWSKRLGEEKDNEMHDWWGRNDRKWHLLVDQIAKHHVNFRGHVDELELIDDHLNRAAIEWILNMQKGIELCEEKKNIMLVKYEDLLINTKSSFESILEFCDLKEDEIFLNYAIKKYEPRPPKKEIKLHPIIMNAFNDTMNALGY